MKLTKHAWILWGIALVEVLVLAFIIPFVKTAVYWIALLCTIVMFCACARSFSCAFRKNSKLESKLLGWPIFKVGYVALIVQIVIGFALMGLAALCPVWIAVITEVAVFAISAFCMTVKDAVREALTVAEMKVDDNTAAWKAIRTRADAVAAETGHPEIKKLAEEIRYADPTPTAMDGEIAQMVDKLCSCVEAENIAKARKLLIARKSLSMEGKKMNTSASYNTGIDRNTNTHQRMDI